MNTTTTTYGTWAQHGNGEIDLETNVAVVLGDFADDYDIDDLVAAYREAINEALPEGVSLHGSEFYGPYPALIEGDEVRAAIESVDFWALAQQHDTTT